MENLRVRFLVMVNDNPNRRAYVDGFYIKENEEPWEEMVAKSVREVLLIKLKRLIREMRVSDDAERFIESGELQMKFGYDNGYGACEGVPMREEVLSGSLAAFVEFYKQVFPQKSDMDFNVHLKVGELSDL